MGEFITASYTTAKKNTDVLANATQVFHSTSWVLDKGETCVAVARMTLRLGLVGDAGGLED